MFSKTQTPEQRLAAFRQLRQQRDLTQNKLIQAFSDVKILPRYLDYYTPENWPGVFEIVQDGLFCQSGITLVMTALLDHLNFLKEGTVELRAVSNHITGAEGLILIAQEQCYNFLPGEIVTIPYMAENSITLAQHIVIPRTLMR